MNKFMEQVYKKIERYLKREFPKAQIVKGNANHFLINTLTEYYGTGGMMIMVSEQGDKLFYQLIKKK